MDDGAEELSLQGPSCRQYSQNTLSWLCPQVSERLPVTATSPTRKEPIESAGRSGPGPGDQSRFPATEPGGGGAVLGL